MFDPAAPSISTHAWYMVGKTTALWLSCEEPVWRQRTRLLGDGSRAIPGTGGLDRDLVAEATPAVVIAHTYKRTHSLFSGKHNLYIVPSCRRLHTQPQLDFFFPSFVALFRKTWPEANCTLVVNRLKWKCSEPHNWVPHDLYMQLNLKCPEGNMIFLFSDFVIRFSLAEFNGWTGRTEVGSQVGQKPKTLIWKLLKNQQSHEFSGFVNNKFYFSHVIYFCFVYIKKYNGSSKGQHAVL